MINFFSSINRQYNYKTVSLHWEIMGHMECCVGLVYIQWRGTWQERYAHIHFFAHHIRKLTYLSSSINMQSYWCLTKTLSWTMARRGAALALLFDVCSGLMVLRLEAWSRGGREGVCKGRWQRGSVSWEEHYLERWRGQQDTRPWGSEHNAQQPATPFSGRGGKTGSNHRSCDRDIGSNRVVIL